MSESNSPQTLFRFVSLRNPKLAETTKSNLSFIHRPEKLEGVFDLVVQTSANESKFEALLAEATNFESFSIKSIAELEEIGFGQLLKIGKSVANQNKLSSNDIKFCKDFYQKFTSDYDSLKKLWENLIYQVISQKNFYIKESIAHIIKALHIGYVKSLTLNAEFKKVNGEILIEKAINAKIVLPKELFEENITTAVIENKTTSENLSNRENNFLRVTSEKNQIEQSFAFERDNFISLKLELKAIQKKHNISYFKEYKISYEKYNSDNLENIKVQEEQSRVIAELKKNKATDEELKKAFDELKKNEIPPFEFIFKKELNWQDIYKKLSSDSFGWFLNYFSDAEADNFKNIDYSKAKIAIVSDEELKIDGNSIFFTEENYTTIFDKIENQIQQLSRNLLNQVTLQQDKFANIGGVLIPISKNNDQIVHLSYVLKAFKPSSKFLTNTNLGYVSLQVKVENSSWSVSHALVTAETNLGTQTESFDNIEVIDNQINFVQFLKNKFKDIKSLSIQLFFNNGKETTLNLKDVTINTDITGLLFLNSSTNNSSKTNSKERILLELSNILD